MLKHSGFNAFQLSRDTDLKQAAESLTDFSENYQTTNASLYLYSEDVNYRLLAFLFVFEIIEAVFQLTQALISYGSLCFSDLFLCFYWRCLLASIALFGRQPLLVAYIALGAFMGPYGMAWVTDVDLIANSHYGHHFPAIFTRLGYATAGSVACIAGSYPYYFISSLLFAVVGLPLPMVWLLTGRVLDYRCIHDVLSTIGIKLLPTTALSQTSGELVVGMLLMQDFLAIFVLLFLLSLVQATAASNFLTSLIALPLVVGGSILLCVVLQPLFARFDRIGEYVFLLAIGWCMGAAEAPR